MPSYRRNHVKGGTYFFTVNLKNRASTLLVDQIDHLRNAIRTVRTRHPFIIDAWVVLPDHMHAVWTLPADDADYPARWRLIKTGFTRAVGGGDIWQPRYWEHTIADEVDRANHIDYVHVNPQKHGLVQVVADWPWSSFHRYVERGVYPRDWGGTVASSSTMGERGRHHA